MPTLTPAPKTQAMNSSSRATDLLRFSGVAIGLFILVNVLGEALRGPFDTLDDWITIPGPGLVRALLELSVAAALLANGFVPLRSPRVRAAGALLFGGAAAVALFDAALFYLALARGTIRTPALIPASLLVAAWFVALTFEIARLPPPRPPFGLRRALLAVLVIGAVLFALPLVRMMTFGPTRYERNADCAVVLGARVWDDGTPSQALADRVDEAIRLQRAGLVRRILMSGAIDPHNGFSEPQVMRARAVEAGVPESAVLLDEEGVDTASTARNTGRIFKREGIESALVVSHYYHEPRLKMLFARAGIRAYTVPARMTRRLLKEPYFVAREVVAFYHSFLFQ